MALPPETLTRPALQNFSYKGPKYPNIHRVFMVFVVRTVIMVWGIYLLLGYLGPIGLRVSSLPGQVHRCASCQQETLYDVLRAGTLNCREHVQILGLLQAAILKARQ